MVTSQEVGEEKPSKNLPKTILNGIDSKKLHILRW